MTQGSAGHREDVEQARRRFAEFRRRMRCGRGYRKSYGRRRRSWRGGMGSQQRRGRWAWTGRVCRSGRIDWSLALQVPARRPRRQRRAGRTVNAAPAFVELLAQTAGATGNGERVVWWK